MKAGDTLTFQIYRFDAGTSNAPKVADVSVEPSFVTGDDTVAAVTEKLRALVPQPLREDDVMVLYFSRRPMQLDRLFYADHFILLPAWIQAVVHRPEEADAVRKMGGG